MHSPQWFTFTSQNFADETEIDISPLSFSGVNLRHRKMSAGETARLSTEVLDRFHNFRINLARENAIDNFGAGASVTR